MDRLPGWGNVSALVLSCPGPLRRHSAALIPVGEVALPQVLLGAESQLLAFAAAATGLSDRMFFAPFPEMFPDAGSLRAAWRKLGGRAPAGQGGRLVHLRFGGARSARVLKGVRNGCVLAEQGSAAPLTASHHPFASGLVLPAAIQRVFCYGTDRPRLHTVLGAPIPSSRLPPACVAADLAGFTPVVNGLESPDHGLDLVSLAEFRSLAWAAGPVRSRGPGLADDTDRRARVLVPWNMDHPGSIVPHLLERLARLYVSAPRPGQAAMPRLVLLPFNYVGQTGIIRRLIGRLRDAAHEPAAFLAAIHLARTGSLAAVASLARAASRAWVDGNDPEHGWTLARLSACGIAPVLIDPGTHAAPPGVARVFADEAIWVEAETRCGTLTFPARLPSFRALPGLLAQSPRPSRQGGRARRGGISRPVGDAALQAGPA